MPACLPMGGNRIGWGGKEKRVVVVRGGKGWGEGKLEEDNKQCWRRRKRRLKEDSAPKQSTEIKDGNKYLPIHKNLFPTIAYSTTSKIQHSGNVVPSARSWKTWTWPFIPCCGACGKSISFGMNRVWVWIPQPLKTRMSLGKLSNLHCKPSYVSPSGKS